MPEKEPNPLFSFVEKLAKVAEQAAVKKRLSHEEAVKYVAQRAEKISPLRQRMINEAKDKAAEWSKKAKSPMTPTEYAEAQKWVKDCVYTPKNFAEAKQLLNDVQLLAAEKHQSAPSWLRADTIQYNPQAAEFAARIAFLPVELQNDPAVLLQEAAKFYWSVKWTDPELNYETHKEAREMLDRVSQRIVERVEEIRKTNPDALPEFGPTNKQGFENMMAGIDRVIDVYRTKRMKPVEQVPNEPPTKLVKDKATGQTKRVIDKDKLEDWQRKKIAWDQYSRLDRLLRTSQHQLDNPPNAIATEQLRVLRDLEKDLKANQVRPAPRNKFLDEYTAIDEATTKPYLEQVKAERERMQNVVDREREYQRLVDEARREARVNAQRAAAEKLAREAAAFSFKPREGKRWIDEVPPPLDAEGNIAINNQDLRRGIEELRTLSQSKDWRSIDAKFVELRALRPQLNSADLEYLDSLFDTAAEYLEFGPGEVHWVPTADELYQLQTSTDAREAKFYDLISDILDNPNEQAYKQFGLYEQYNYRTFTRIIRRTPIRDESGRLVGDRLVAHYQNLFDSIMRLSDGEWWASQPSGDAEGLQKHMNFFRNIFAIEATADPLVVHYMQAYEQAFEFVRDLHDQYMPNQLFAHDAALYETFVDKIADDLVLQRVEAGAVYDYKRDPRTGLPELDPRTEGRKLALQENPLTRDQFEKESFRLRVKAARRMGKGMQIMTFRLTETAAFTRTPGVEIINDGFNGEFTTEGAFFSSKPYGGITRWENFLAEWLKMYKFGDTLAPDFLNTVIGAPEGWFGAEKKALGWTMDDVVDVINIAETGDRELLERKYGKKVVRLMDKIEDLTFTGRFGNNSLWGTLDSTKGWTDWDRERLGGSMRLSIVQTLADSLVEREFKDAFYNRFKGPDWDDTIGLQTEWLKAKIGEKRGVIEETIERVMNGTATQIERDQWHKKVKDLGSTYKAWVWTQYIMRNPQGAAAHVFVDYGPMHDSKVRSRLGPDGKRVPEQIQYRAKLKSKIFYEIFTTAEDLEPFGLNVKDGLVVERDVSSVRTLSQHQFSLMERLKILDGDLMAVQSYAMDSEFRPRDIRDEPGDSDFDRCIVGPKKIKAYKPDGDVTWIEISEATRRRQAREYFQKVQREFLGKALGATGPGWDVNKWREELQAYWIDKPPTEGGTESTDAKKTHQTLRFRSPERIADIFERAQSESRGLMTRSLVDKRFIIHMGTEDVQWRHLDLNVLGDRQQGRIGNDFLTHAKTGQMELELFHSLKGRPDWDKLEELLEKIGQNEKGWDPAVAAKHYSLFNMGIDNIYRQDKLGGVPFAGKILPQVFNIPMSRAQKKLGARVADAQSMNNRLRHADKMAQSRILPQKQIMDGVDYGPYTMESFYKQAGISRWLALAETLVIGYAIAAVLTTAAATAKSVEAETKP